MSEIWHELVFMVLVLVIGLIGFALGNMWASREVYVATYDKDGEQNSLSKPRQFEEVTQTFGETTLVISHKRPPTHRAP